MRAIFIAWLNRVFEMETMSGDGVCPVYLYRWTLLKCGSLFSIYLHKFVGDDWAIDLHDHPKRFVSIGLRGSYIETFFCPCRSHDNHPATRVWNAPWLRTFAAEHVHRLTGPTPERPCWTLVIVGRSVRQWGFWLRGSWVPWRAYVKDNASARKACS